MKKCGEIW